MTSPGRSSGKRSRKSDPRAAAHAADRAYRAAQAHAEELLAEFRRTVADARAAVTATRAGGPDPGFKLIDLSRDSYTIKGSKGWSRHPIEVIWRDDPPSDPAPDPSVDLRARAHAADRAYQDAAREAERLLGEFRARVVDAAEAVRAKRAGGPDPGFAFADIIRDTWTIEGSDGWSHAQMDRFARASANGRLRADGTRLGQDR